MGRYIFKKIMVNVQCKIYNETSCHRVWVYRFMHKLTDIYEHQFYHNENCAEESPSMIKRIHRVVIWNTLSLVARADNPSSPSSE